MPLKCSLNQTEEMLFSKRKQRVSLSEQTFRIGLANGILLTDPIMDAFFKKINHSAHQHELQLITLHQVSHLNY